MTDIYFSFDTEDFTSDYSSNAIFEEAEILKKYDIKGNFNIVGFLARELIKNKRYDVLDSLKSHTVSFHSLSHSYHPNLCEYTDVESFDEAYKEFLMKESEGLGMVKSAFGEDEIYIAVPPGNAMSYVGLYAYADMGLPVYGDSNISKNNNDGLYFCNALHIAYDILLENYLFDENFDVDALLNEIANKKRCVIYTHPNMAVQKVFWDELNYKHININPMYHWEEPEHLPKEKTELFYSNFDKLCKALKEDNRFKIGIMTDLSKLINTKNRVINKEDLKDIYDNLNKKFTCFKNLSIADCFFCARHFLFSDEPYKTDFVHGFLEEPMGTKKEVKLSKEEVIKLSKPLYSNNFIPHYFEINNKIIGPADLLFAMLEIAMGKEEVTVLPKKQQCEYEEISPYLKNMNLKGTWMHSNDFEDKYLSNRTRLQAWTLRKV